MAIVKKPRAAKQHRPQVSAVEIPRIQTGGRKPFIPTAEQRRLVETMSGYGTPQEGIALIINIDLKTLRLRFRRELDLGVTKANSEVGKSLYNMAVNGNIAAAIFWTKARMGWREVVKIENEHSGPGGKPLQVVSITTSNPVEASKIYQKLMGKP